MTDTTNELIPNQKGMTSLEIAEITGKRHDAILRDIRNLLKQGVSHHNFVETSYKQSQPRGGYKELPCFNLTPKGCLILASGYDAVLREKIINRLEYLENEKKVIRTPQSYIEALEALVVSEKEKEKLRFEIEQQQKQIEQKENKIAKMHPKAEFADCIMKSKDCITIGDLANILKQSCLFSKGKNALACWMRNNGYLLQKGIRRNMPTQKSMALGLMRVIETTSHAWNGTIIINKTVGITSLGQRHFIAQFRALLSSKESYEIEW